MSRQVAERADAVNATGTSPAPGAVMRAGVYRGAGSVIVEQVPVPEIGAGEVLIRVAACGVCGTDIKKIHHGFLPPPQIFGHEMAGTVAAVGAGVTRWRPGDRVLSFHHVPCGACFYCERKLFSQCDTYKRVGVTAGFKPAGGGFSEYVRVMPWIADRGMVAIPDDVTFDEATFVEPVNTCLKCVQKGRVTAGEVVLVIGQGPIGLLLMLLARLQGAMVLTTDLMAERRAASLRFGAGAAFDPSARGAGGGLLEEIRARTGGRGADVVLVVVPSAAVVAEALSLTRPGGRVVLFAHNDPQMTMNVPAAGIGIDEKELLGSYSASIELQAESARLVFERRLPVAQLVSHRFPLDRIGEALDLAARPDGHSLKVVIAP
jgi:L-iditol 2-dehydrogenase